MRARTLIVGLILAAAAGCGAPPAPGTPVTQASACTKENNDQRVSIEGYPRLSGMTYVSDDFSVDLFEQPQGQGESVSVYLPVGSGANQAENLPDNYSDDDLHIHTNTNAVVSTDSHIRVSGTLSWSEPSPGTAVCFVSSVDLIEAVTAS